MLPSPAQPLQGCRSRCTVTQGCPAGPGNPGLRCLTPAGNAGKDFFSRNLRGLQGSAIFTTAAPTTRISQIAYFTVQKSLTALPGRGAIN